MKNKLKNGHSWLEVTYGTSNLTAFSLSITTTIPTITVHHLLDV